jgi:hypothetical protein
VPNDLPIGFSLPWVRLLDRYARRVNPWLGDGLPPMQYYWVTTQSEYATDPVFKSPQHLAEFFPRLLEHSTLCFSARDVPSFLGRKWHGKFEGEVVTDQFDHGFNGRWPGRRIKHRMKRNWRKMDEKAGWVLRVETVINDPEEFRGRRRVRRRDRRRTEWVPLRKSGAYLFRYRDVAPQSTARYLNALAHVEDPTPGLRGLDTMTTRKSPAEGRTVKACNPVACPITSSSSPSRAGSTPCTGSRTATCAPSSTTASAITRNRTVLRSVASSTASPSTGWSRRSPARVAGASLGLVIGS